MSIFSELGVEKGKHRLPEEMLYNIAACYSLAESYMASILARHGLSPVKMNALLIIRHAGGRKGLAQNEIGRRLIVTASNITRLLDRLQAEGLIERVADKDRRVNRTRITSKGAAILDKAWPDYQAGLRRLGGGVPEKELKRMKGTLEAFRERLRAVNVKKGETK